MDDTIITHEFVSIVTEHSLYFFFCNYIEWYIAEEYRNTNLISRRLLTKLNYIYIHKFLRFWFLNCYNMHTKSVFFHLFYHLDIQSFKNPCWKKIVQNILLKKGTVVYFIFAFLIVPRIHKIIENLKIFYTYGFALMVIIKFLLFHYKYLHSHSVHSGLLLIKILKNVKIFYFSKTKTKLNYVYQNFA